jgi:hypothetical protein
LDLNQKEAHLKKIEGIRAELTAGERKLGVELADSIEAIAVKNKEKAIEVRRKNDSGKEFALNKHRERLRDSLQAQTIADKEKEFQKIRADNQAELDRAAA